MAANMGAIPGRGGNQTPASMDDLVGAPPESPQNQQQGPTPEQQMQQVMAQVRKIHGDIEALARQFPDGAKAARKAKEGLIEMMNSIVASQKAPEPEAPKGMA